MKEASQPPSNQTPTEQVPKPTPPPASSPIKPRIVLSVVLMVFLLSLVTFTFVRALRFNSQVKNQIPSPQTTKISTPTPDPTENQVPNGNLENWKTYQNQIVNFQFNYPDNWIINSNPDQLYVSVYKSKPYINQFRIQARDKSTWSTNYTLDQIAPELKHWEIFSTAFWGDADPKEESQETINIGNVKAIKFIYKLNDPGLTFNHIMWIVTTYGNYVLTISAAGEDIDTLKQILSTFRFLDKSNPWDKSVCGNKICEPCENECCNYPCSTDNNGQEYCPPPVCLGRCPQDCRPGQEIECEEGYIEVCEGGLCDCLKAN